MTATTMVAGRRLREDLQADIWMRPYETVAPVEGERGVWLCRYVEPTDEELEEMLEIAATCEGNQYIDAERELAELIDRIGETFKTRFVTREQWNAAF